MSTDLLILGASVRAAACSALRGGLTPCGGDLFADVDLTARCRAQRADPYPADLVRIARESPPAPWMYTGGLENHPMLVDEIAATRPLLGNPGSVLRRVRDPFLLAKCLEEFPDCLSVGATLHRDGSWLRKSLRSCGGGGISVWDTSNPAAGDEPGYYFQQRLEGVPTAGLFVAARGESRLLGVSEQLIGVSWAGASGFRYCGSMGPLHLDDLERVVWQRIGNRLAADFDLRGLFGVDAIRNGAEIRPVEVNPRYPASAEVLERALGFSAVECHVRACRDGALPDERSRSRQTLAVNQTLASSATTVIDASILKAEIVSVAMPDWFGKLIVYSSREGVVSHESAVQLKAASLVNPWPELADVPSAWQAIRAGWPICTVFAAANDRIELLTRLQNEAGRVAELVCDGTGRGLCFGIAGIAVAAWKRA